MSIVPVIFTYSPDGPCALEAAGALVDAGFPVIYVAEDAFRPLLQETRAAMLDLGCRCMQTHHQPSKAGQYGRVVLTGIADTYGRIVEETGTDYLYKVDSDTIVNRTDRMREAAGAGVAAAGWAWLGWGFSGSCSLISRRAAAAIREACYAAGPLPAGLSDAACPEDLASATIARTVGDVWIWPYDPAGGYGAGYQYHHATIDLAEYARRFDCVTFGNRSMLEGTPCDRRAQVALTMAEYRRVLKAR